LTIGDQFVLGLESFQSFACRFAEDAISATHDGHATGDQRLLKGNNC
jgi:hypothetical protein